MSISWDLLIYPFLYYKDFKPVQLTVIVKFLPCLLLGTEGFLYNKDIVGGHIHFRDTFLQCSKFVKIIARPQDGLLSKVVRPRKKWPTHTFIRELHVNSLVAGNKPVLQDGLDPLFARPHPFLSVSGGRTGLIWNTDFW